MSKLGLIHTNLRWHGDYINVKISQHPSDWWDVVVTADGPSGPVELFSISADTAERAWERVTDQVLGVFRKEV